MIEAAELLPYLTFETRLYILILIIQRRLKHHLSARAILISLARPILRAISLRRAFYASLSSLIRLTIQTRQIYTILHARLALLIRLAILSILIHCPSPHPNRPRLPVLTLNSPKYTRPSQSTIQINP